MWRPLLLTRLSVMSVSGDSWFRRKKGEGGGRLLLVVAGLISRVSSQSKPSCMKSREKIFGLFCKNKDKQNTDRPFLPTMLVGHGNWYDGWYPTAAVWPTWQAFPREPESLYSTATPTPLRRFLSSSLNVRSTNSLTAKSRRNLWKCSKFPVQIALDICSDLARFSECEICKP